MNFLAMLAHELRNPLSAVANAVTVLRMSQDEENAIFAREVIDRQVRQLTRLIDDLLDVSRITSGKNPPASSGPSTPFRS